MISCWPASSFAYDQPLGKSLVKVDRHSKLPKPKSFDICYETMNLHITLSSLCEQARRSSAKWAQLSHGCCCFTAHYGLPTRQGCWMVCVLGRTVLAGLMPYTIGLHSRPVFTSRPTTKLGPSHYFFWLFRPTRHVWSQLWHLSSK